MKSEHVYKRALIFPSKIFATYLKKIDLKLNTVVYRPMCIYINYILVLIERTFRFIKGDTESCSRYCEFFLAANSTQLFKTFSAF